MASADLPAPAPRASQRRRPTDVSWALLASPLVIIVVGVVVASGVARPLIYADEAGYLLNARHLAGLGEPSGTGYFSGYSYFLAPVQLVADTYPAIARGTQLVNLVLAVASYFLLVHLLERLVPSARKATVRGVALLTMLYPFYSVMVGLALAENLLVPAFLGVTALVERAARLRTTSALLMAGVAAGAIVAVHPRAVVVPIGMGLVVAHGVVRRLVRFGEALRLGAGVAAGGAIAAGALAATSSLPLGNASAGNSQTGFLGRFDSFDAVRDALVALSGQAFYAVAATFGLVAVGFAVLAGLARGPRSSIASSADDLRWVARFVVTAVALGAVLSAMFMAGGTGDKLIYGRYNEAFLALPLAVGVLTVARVTAWRPWGIAATGSVVVAAILARIVIDPSQLATRYNRSNIVAVLPVVDSFGGIRIWIIAGISAALAAVLVGVAWLAGARWFLLALGVVFVSSSTWTAVNYLAESSRAREREAILVPVMREAIESTGSESCVTLDRRGASQWHQYNYRVLLPRIHFDRVLLDREPPRCGDLVLSSVADVPELIDGARMVAADNHSGFSLWARPGALLDHLDRSGRLFPTDWDGRLPDSAMQADVEVVGGLCRRTDDAVDPLDVVLTHQGDGSPWPNDASQTPGAIGAVRVVVEGSDGDILLEGRLAQTMFPGETTRVLLSDVEADAVALQGEGPFQLRVLQTGGGPSSHPVEVDLVLDGEC